MGTVYHTWTQRTAGPLCPDCQLMIYAGLMAMHSICNGNITTPMTFQPSMITVSFGLQGMTCLYVIWVRMGQHNQL